MSTNSGIAPACEIASVVPMNVCGTVNTTSPVCTPEAIIAKRNASVPLLMAIEWLVPQKAANAFSNSSTIGPPMKPAVSRAWRNTPVSCCSSSRCGVTRSRKGMFSEFLLEMLIFTLHYLVDMTENPGRVSGHDGVGWNIFRDNTAGAHDDILTDVRVREDRGPRPDRCTCLDDRRFDLPIRVGF